MGSSSLCDPQRPPPPRQNSRPTNDCHPDPARRDLIFYSAPPSGASGRVAEGSRHNPSIPPKLVIPTPALGFLRRGAGPAEGGRPKSARSPRLELLSYFSRLYAAHPSTRGCPILRAFCDLCAIPMLFRDERWALTMGHLGPSSPSFFSLSPSLFLVSVTSAFRSL